MKLQHIQSFHIELECYHKDTQFYTCDDENIDFVKHYYEIPLVIYEPLWISHRCYTHSNLQEPIYNPHPLDKGQ